MIADAMAEHYLRSANPVPHVDDLDADEFARFVALANTRRAALMQAAPQERTQQLPTPPRQHGKRVWAFALASILVLVSIGVLAFLLTGGDDEVADEPSPTVTTTEARQATTSTAPETTTTIAVTTTVGAAPQSFDVESLVWSQVPIASQAAFIIQRESGLWERILPHTVIAGGPGYVAFGSDTNPFVWTSPDGISWSRGSMLEGGYMKAATAGGPGLVAVRGRKVWTSPDGIDWSAVVVHEDVFALSYMADVTVGGPGLVGVGSGARERQDDEFVPLVWTSLDGITWSRVPYDPDAFGEAGRGTGMFKVASGDPGLVALGGFKGDEAVWTSPDGITWSLHTEPLDEADLVDALKRAGHVVGALHLNDVAAGGPGFVAVGAVQTGRRGCEPNRARNCYAAVWTSTDGAAWTMVPYDEDVFGSPTSKQRMESIVAVGDGFIAVGTSVWASPDGLNWSKLLDEMPVSLCSADYGYSPVSGPRACWGNLAAGDHGLVAVVPYGDRPGIWIAQPED